MHALEELALIWLAVLFAHYAARVTRLTSVLFYLFAGAVLVNTGLLAIEHDPFIRTFAEIGIILIMFALGFEENTVHFLKSIKRSWGIAFFGGLAPFLAAYGVTWFLFEDANIALVSGLAMTATAVSLTMVSLKSEGLSRSPAALGIMTSAVLDDIASLALVAILIPVATGAASPDPLSIAIIAGKAILFFALIAILAAWILPQRARGALDRIPILKNFGIRKLLTFADGELSILVLFIFALGVGILAHLEGFHPAVGAYMAGLIIKEEFFDKAHDAPGDRFHKVKEQVDNIAFTWIGPVFFVELGTKIIFDLSLFAAVLPSALMLAGVLAVAQILSAGLAARYTGAFPWADSWMIGFGMLGRAELAFVVMDIAYVQNTILTEAAFYTLMIAAFLLNAAVPVSIKLWKPRLVASELARARAAEQEGRDPPRNALPAEH